MSDVIEIRNLRFSYDKEIDVVDSVSLTIKKGTYTTIIGHNGSGKSTIAKLIIGLLAKDEGDIFVDGIELSDKTVYDIRKKIGIVFQNPDNQFIGATVRDDIAFGLENHLIPHDQMDDIITTFAQKVHMDKFLDHEPIRLSGGQKQRVAIAGVLAMAPDIIILDEATSMLDPQGKAEIKKLVQQINQEKEITIVSITHDIEEAAKSDYVIVLDEGKVHLQGTPQEVLVKMDDLVRLDLDAPFAVKLAKKLQMAGIQVSTPVTMEGLVSELCQLHLNK